MTIQTGLSKKGGTIGVENFPLGIAPGSALQNRFTFLLGSVHTTPPLLIFANEKFLPYPIQ